MWKRSFIEENCFTFHVFSYVSRVPLLTWSSWNFFVKTIFQVKLFFSSSSSKCLLCTPFASEAIFWNTLCEKVFQRKVFSSSTFFNIFLLLPQWHDVQNNCMWKPSLKEYNFFSIFKFKYFIFLLIDPIDTIFRIILCENDKSSKSFFNFYVFFSLSHVTPFERSLEKIHVQLTIQRIWIASSFFNSSFSCTPIDTIFSIILCTNDHSENKSFLHFFISSFSCTLIDTIFSIILLRKISWRLFFWNLGFIIVYVC